MKTTCSFHSWTAPDGHELPYAKWDAAGEPRAVIVAVHGLSGAAIDYEPLGARLSPLDFTIRAPDLRGQGNDPNPRHRGDLRNLADWFADLRAFRGMVRAQHPGLPFFYYGESMGAALLIRYLAQADPDEQPDGLVLASPVVAIAQALPRWMEWLFRFILAVRPGYRIDVRRFTKHDPEPKLVTRDEAYRAWFATAPHKLEIFTVRFFARLHELIAGCYAAAPKIRVPTLVLYAAHDVFIPPALVEEFFARLGAADKEQRFFPESYHLLLHDHDHAEVLAAIQSWLEHRLPHRALTPAIPAAG
jgi:alpha-beta hydrolase superfamily lysophospholipase